MASTRIRTTVLLWAGLASVLTGACGADSSTVGSKDGGGDAGNAANADGDVSPRAGSSGVASGGTAGMGARPGAGAPSHDGGAPSSGGSASSRAGGAHSGSPGSGGVSGMPDGSVAPTLSPADVACRTDHPSSTEDCTACCDTNHPMAYLAQADATHQCLCTSPGTCASPCATTYCVQQEINGTTPNCLPCIYSQLVSDGGCYQAGVDACGSNSECLGYVVCRANCLR
jgi:hypothetical protein